MAAEGRIRVTRTEREVTFDDGAKAALEVPRYAIVDTGYGPLDANVMTSPRVAPPMIGLGLLEAVAASDILARADPDDADGDGISGRARRVWSRENGRMMLGRFGWKAGAASIVDQSADAMSGDIGVSSPLAPEPWGECTARQRACRLGPHGADAGEFEAPAAVMDAIVFYSRHLAVPARRGADDPTVLRGKALFYRIGCTGCHTPKHATRRDWPVEELAGQLIWPYTDLLVHDMGGRPGGRSPRRRCVGPRVADRAAVGNRPDRGRQRTHPLPARRTCPQPRGGHPLARRRGGSLDGRIPVDVETGPGRARGVSEFAVTEAANPGRHGTTSHQAPGGDSVVTSDASTRTTRQHRWRYALGLHARNGVDNSTTSNKNDSHY